MDIAQEEKYVVLHSGVASWSKGDVVSEEQLLQKGTDIGRLLRLGSIRMAMQSERGLRKVTLSDSITPSHEQLVSDMKANQLRQEARIAELEATIANQDRVIRLDQQEGSAALVRSKDQHIANLDAELSRKAKTIQDLNERVILLESELAKLRQESKRNETAVPEVTHKSRIKTNEGDDASEASRDYQSSLFQEELTERHPGDPRFQNKGGSEFSIGSASRAENR